MFLPIPRRFALEAVSARILFLNSRVSCLSSFGAASMKSTVGDFPVKIRPSPLAFRSMTVSHFRFRPLYFTHKKTLHYLLGYFALGTLLFITALESHQNSFWLLVLACGSVGAGVHCIMDPFDGWRDDNPQQGIYERLTRRWLPSLQLVVFAHMWEWVIQAFATIWFIAISAHLSHLLEPGWLVTTGTYFAIWIVSAAFDVHIRASDRQARELRLLTIKKSANLTVSQTDTNDADFFKTLDKKLMMGYQGWFACPGDGSPPNRWWHWFGDPPNQSTLTVDMWPEFSDTLS